MKVSVIPRKNNGGLRKLRMRTADEVRNAQKKNVFSCRVLRVYMCAARLLRHTQLVLLLLLLSEGCNPDEV